MITKRFKHLCSFAGSNIFYKDIDDDDINDIVGGTVSGLPVHP